jgi:hypothetical protein
MRSGSESLSIVLCFDGEIICKAAWRNWGQPIFVQLSNHFEGQVELDLI